MKRLIVVALLILAALSPLLGQNAIVRELSGKVEYRLGNGAWQGATAGQQLALNATISTGFGASAILQIGAATNGSVLEVSQLTRLTLEELIEREGGGEIQSISACDYRGRQLNVESKTFVLATGGLENPRVLLMSQRLHPSGVGNLHDQVGRYYMDHTGVYLGQVVFNQPAKLDSVFMKKHISGDAFEALIGAIYLDKGYYRTKRFILKNILIRHIDLEILEKTENNFKSQLIEWGQKYKKNVCFYTDVEPYDPTRFISYVSIGDNLYGSGTGISKKEAEQMAASETLKELR